MAKLKEPHQLAGKQLTTGSCPECKKAVTIRANKNGIAYFFCTWPHTATGDRCNHHGRFSAGLSRKLCTAYLNSRKSKETYDHANDNRPPKEAIATSQR